MLNENEGSDNEAGKISPRRKGFATTQSSLSSILGRSAVGHRCFCSKCCDAEVVYPIQKSNPFQGLQSFKRHIKGKMPIRTSLNWIGPEDPPSPSLRVNPTNECCVVFLWSQHIRCAEADGVMLHVLRKESWDELYKWGHFLSDGNEDAHFGWTIAGHPANLPPQGQSRMENVLHSNSHIIHRTPPPLPPSRPMCVVLVRKKM